MRKINMNICDECKGKGSKLIRQFKLFETCKKCHGYGEITWLDKIFRKNSEYYDSCLKNNVEILLQCITEYCDNKGIKIEIKINGVEFKNYYR